MTSKNIFLKNLVKSRPAYKISDNILKIDNRIESYDYEIQSDISCIFTFDIDLNLIFASSLSDFILKIPLNEVFPTDMQDFFYEILEETKIKGKTKYHVELNNRHILYTSTIVTDQFNKIICISLAELPFRNVQSISVIAPKIKKDFDNSKIHISYIVDSAGTIFASESKSIDTNYLNDKSNQIVVDGSSIYNILSCEAMKGKWASILKYITLGGTKPVVFMVYTDDEKYMQKTMVTVTKMRMFGSEKDSLSLINTEIKNQKDFDVPQSYLSKIVKNDENKIFYNVCNCCKKIEIPIDSYSSLDRKKYIQNYDEIIPPLKDSETGILIFGRRSKNGKISYKDDNKFFWITPQMLNTSFNQAESVKIKSKLKEDFEISHTICNLCNDEWNHYLAELVK